MRNQVIIRPRQQFLADDANNIEGFARASLDEALLAGLGAQKRYWGFLTEKIGPAEIRVAAGLLFLGGPVHGRDIAGNIDMIGNLPLAAQRRVAIVAWGQETETDVQRRNFRTDVTTNAVEPQDVNMRRSRVANVDAIYGQESANPQLPPIDPGYVHIATVLLTTTGVDSVTMNEAARLKSAQDIYALALQTEAWRAIAEPLLSTIRSDIAGLAERLRTTVSLRALETLTYDVAILKETAGIEDDASSYGADRYLTDDEMDLAHAQSDCRIEEGIRANFDGVTEQAISLFSALDPAAQVNDTTGMLLPKYKEVVRVDVTGYAGDIALNSFAVTDLHLTQKSASRQRIRYGSTRTVCTNSAWWKSGQYDPMTGVFSKEGEMFTVAWEGRVNGQVGHEFVRLIQFWVDTWEEPYWDAAPVTSNVAGAVVAQTGLVSQGGWYLGSEFLFTDVAANGPVTMLLCETTAGAPDLTKVVASVTKQPNELKVSPEYTHFGVPPIWHEPGKRYAKALVSQGGHRIAEADKNRYLEGSRFVTTDGGWFSGDLTRDIIHRDIYAEFSQARSVMEMSPVSLAGGVTDLDLLYDCICPPGSELTWEIQPEGQSVWKQLAGGAAQSLLHNKPALVRLRAVFNGTSDVQPMIRLTGSRLRATRCKKNWTGISEPIILPEPSNAIVVVSELGSFDAAQHTAAISLINPAGVNVTPSTVEDKPTADGIRRRATFNLGAAVGSFRIKHVCGGVSDRELFQVNETVWNAF